MSKMFTNGFYIIVTVILFLGIAAPVQAQYTRNNFQTGGLFTALVKDGQNNIYFTRVKPESGGSVYEVLRYSTTAGTLVLVYTGLTHEIGDYPWGLAVTTNGDVYVSTDFTSNGGSIIKLIHNVTDDTYSGTTFQTGHYYSALALDAANNLYTAEYDAANGTYAVVKYAANSPASSAGANLYDNLKSAPGYTYPTGLAVATDGDIFVADAFSNDPSVTDGGRIVKLTAASGYAALNVSTGRYASALTTDGAGNLYSSENSGSGYQLVKYANGAGSGTPIYGPLNTNGVFYPWGIAFINNDSIYAIDGDDGTIGGALIQLTSTLTIAPPSPPVISYTTPQTYITGAQITQLAPLNSGGAVPNQSYEQVSTLAGSGMAGNTNGTGTAASFKSPFGTAIDAAGNMYVADAGNNLIRKIAPGSVVNTFAGSGSYGSLNGTGTAASFAAPRSVVVDASGSVYVADQGSNKIRKITPAGVVTTFAGSGAAGAVNATGTAASFNSPYGLAIDKTGNIFVADNGNNLIREITPAGVVSTLAGSGTAGAVNGTGIAASFHGPRNLAIDNAGNVYVTDYANNIIRKITSAGVVTTFAGSGTAGHADGGGTGASFNLPTGITIDLLGNLYVTEYGNNLVRKISLAGAVTTLAGSLTAGSANGVGIAASFSSPEGLCTDGAGNLYIADTGNQLIRQLGLQGYSISRALPMGLTFDNTTGIINGTPTAASVSINYVISAYNNGGSSSATLSITVNAPPIISYNSPQTYTLGTAIVPLSPVNTGGAVPANIYTQVSTLAGSGTAGAVNGAGMAASFKTPFGAATDASGNIYVADAGNNLIRKITPMGVVTTFAGSGAYGSANGTGTSANFSTPRSVAVDGLGNVYVADQGSNKIRKITPAGVVTTLAGSGAAGAVNGTGTAASFKSPFGVAVDGAGNVYVADNGNNMIRKISPAGLVSTLAGSGAAGATNATGTAASFQGPRGLGLDAAGNLYVADYTNNMIRQITQAGVVTTFAGHGNSGHIDGTGNAATFYAPTGVAVDAFGNIYVSESGDNSIRKITPGGMVSSFAGNNAIGAINGVGLTASFNAPAGLALDGAGNLYIVDTGNQLIRQVVVTGYIATPALPVGLILDSSKGIISGNPATSSAVANYTITAINAGGTGTAVISIAINGPAGPPVISYNGAKIYPDNEPVTPFVPVNTGGVVPPGLYTQVNTFAGNGTAGAVNGTGIAASFKTPFGGATDASGNIYIADAGNNMIRKITPAGVVTTFAGSGAYGSLNATGTAASFSSPRGVAVDAAGNVYVADQGSNKIRKITAVGVVTTLAGSGTAGAVNGTGTAASFNSPFGVAVDASGNIYVADYSNNLIREITPAGVVTTFAGSGIGGTTNGTGTAASFYEPRSLVLDAAGNLYVADIATNLIRKITQTGVVTTFAGNGTAVDADGTGTSAGIKHPGGISIDLGGNLYVVEPNNNVIRQITPAGVVTTIAGNLAPGSSNGFGTAASFNGPNGVFNDALGNLYIADSGNQLIRKMSLTGFIISPTPLPTGLVFDGTTGIISGTPTTVTAATNYTVTAYNQYGTSVATLSIATGTQVPHSIRIKQVDSLAGNELVVKNADLLANNEPMVRQAVSPNGDGINDVLFIEGIENYPDNKVTLINRSGTAVFQISGYDNTGKVFDGHSNITKAMQQPGTYFYLVEYLVKGVLKHKTGYFVLKY